MGRDSNNIDCRVKTYRLDNGWSQDQLAEKVGLKRQAIYDIESGRYLPNTSVALKMAKLFQCRVEDLFVEAVPLEGQPIEVVGEQDGATGRLSVAKVRDRLVGIPLSGPRSIPFGLQSADVIFDESKSAPLWLSSAERLDNAVLLMGCDPAFEILGMHVARRSPGNRVHCLFASSHKALEGLAAGNAHLAGTHLHNTGEGQSNVTLANHLLSGIKAKVIGFSLLEEGLLVAKGNPLEINNITDLTQTKVRFVNREPGAALRVLLDDLLKRAGVPATAVRGYQNEVTNHAQAAFSVVCKMADAALGFRAMAHAYGLDFVPLTAVRCDLVIPYDVISHPTIDIILDVLQSRTLRRELQSLPGYDASFTGKTIAEW
jgi:molybdate-binding protein/DNA-binding XRE family transcriptional regulator